MSGVSGTLQPGVVQQSAQQLPQLPQPTPQPWVQVQKYNPSSILSYRGFVCTFICLLYDLSESDWAEIFREDFLQSNGS